MKASELIKGQYYKFMYDDTKYIFKFNVLLNDEKIFVDKQWYIQNEFYFNTEYFYNRSYYNFEEITLSEVVEYLPLSHPERIIFRKERVNKLLNKY